MGDITPADIELLTRDESQGDHAHHVERPVHVFRQ